MSVKRNKKYGNLNEILAMSLNLLKNEFWFGIIQKNWKI